MNSGQNIIITAHVRDESLFFYDWLHNNTILIILTKPELNAYGEVFHNVCIKKNVTVYCLNQELDMSKDYKLGKREKEIIDSLLSIHEDAKRVITHPKFTRESDAQNRELFDYVAGKNLDNHYIYEKSKNPVKIDRDRKKALMKYCMIFKNEEARVKRLQKYVGIAQKVGKLIRI